MDLHSTNLSRRAFLRRGACAALGTTGLLSTLAQLRVLAAGTAATSNLAVPASEYKALVCVFLYGGNDANNLLIPYQQQAYNAYAQSRSILALPRASLLPISPLGGGSYGLHPSAASLQRLFQSRRLAFLANVGTLIAPVTKAQYESGGAALPSQLFSHSDQSVQWQAALADNPRKLGWGGRMADMLTAFNETPGISMSMSLAGVNTWQNGGSTVQYQVSRDGAVSVDFLDEDWIPDLQKNSFTSLLDLERRNLFEQTLSGNTRRMIDNAQLLNASLAAVPATTAPFGDTELGRQLRMISRLIQAGPSLGFRRQIFFASIGGWDTHDAQIQAHAGLLTEFGNALEAFDQQLNTAGMGGQVTTFTASDFGRTFTTNGKGSDHGWGNHHIIMGGAVRGGELYGSFPQLVVDGPDDTGYGRWIPSTSVDQYSATLARWFGVPDSELPTLFPNIGNFGTRDLGFMT